MTDRELMQQALEALDGLSEPYDVLRIQTALRERLAQPEDRELEQRQYQSTADKCKLETVSAKGGLLPAQQEPVAWMNPMNGVIIDAKKKTQIGEGKGYPSFSVPCYTAIQRKPSGGQDRELMQQALDALEFHTCGDEVDEALITALRERLAQQEQEPVAWQTEETYDKDGMLIGRQMKRGPDCEWEPWLTPQRREWVGLTEQDFSAINQSCLTKLQAATCAESILKEKNA